MRANYARHFSGNGKIIFFAALLSFSPLSPAHSAIYQWQWIDPSNPAQGKRESTTLCPDGAYANALPGANLINLQLFKAYLIGADLSN
jgi:hypothetical protein